MDFFDFFSVLTRHFLDMIQPNDFPFNLTVKLLDDYEEALSDGDTVRALLRYQVGFLVCAVIGILYMVLMPVIGGVLACCRCRGNCGGRMYQMQTPRTDTYRRALYWSLFTTTVIVLLGNIYMFMSIAAFKLDVDQINGTLNILHSNLTDLLEQFDHMMNEIYNIANAMTKNVDSIGSKLGNRIQEIIERKVFPSLVSVEMMTNVSLVNTRSNLTTLNHGLSDVASITRKYKDSLNNCHKSLNNARHKCNYTTNVTMCENLVDDYMEKLKSDEFVQLFDLDYFVEELGEFQSAVEVVDWDSLLVQGRHYLENIPGKISNDTTHVIQYMLKQLDDTKTQMSTLRSTFLISVSSNVTDTLRQLQGNITMYTPEAERTEHILKAVGVVLCCMVLLVIACNVLGLVLGPLGLEPNMDPIVRPTTAHYGGNLLMMSAGFIFPFSWLLMGVVLMLFVPGGNIYALVCKPWNDGQMLKLIDTTSLIGFELGPMLGLNINLSLTDVYSDCQKNTSLWSTLHMDEIINLEEGLNVSQYTDEILRNVNITPDILLSRFESQVKDIYSMANKTNFTVFMQKINKIHSFENTLREMLGAMEEFGELKQAKNYLNTSFNQVVAFNEQYIDVFKSNTENLRSNMHNITGTFREVLRGFDFLKTYNIKTQNRKFVYGQLDNVTVTYAEWTNMTQQVGHCGPVARAVDTVENIICENMVETLNTFWFSLALCLIFFIPSIICSIKLAKYYRRMEHSNEYYKRLEEWNRYVKMSQTRKL